MSLAQWQMLAADTLHWNTNNNRVSADIASAPLLRALEGVSHLTGWHVFLESNASRNVSAKFSDLPSGEALRILLGNLNFALVPGSNSPARLYVFHTLQRNATLRVQPGAISAASQKSKPILNELELILRPGASLGNLPCLENAKVLGRIDSINAYRLQLNDEASAQAVRECLANHPDVESIESSYAIERPDGAQQLAQSGSADFDLQLKEPTGDCAPIVAVLDTRGMQSVPKEYAKFLLPGLSVIDSANREGAAAPVSAGELTHGLAMVHTVLQSVQTTTSSGSSGVRVLPVDIYGNNPTTSTFDVARGIQQAVNNGANIINMSLGSNGDSTVLHNLIKKASDQGVVFFGAAGNEPVTTPVYPAAYPEVVAVTAGNRAGQVADYANRGAFVDLMTPGTTVISLDGKSYVMNGTSAATAYASGIAAALADMNRNCPPGVIPTMKSKLGVTSVPQAY
ncbi:MAG TPA: S8 family serine peptidase [Verrucomicrobiae bacterium]|nr:S8 family serine peptidase [Verrucomicrobiae bacterium]